jgi:hypothetical protein
MTVLPVLAAEREMPWLISPESPGMIRITLTATPRRGLVYAAKTVTLAAFALLVSEACSFTAFLLGQLVLHRQHLNVSITDAHVLRAVTCAGLYMAVVALVGLGVGAALRHTALAMAPSAGPHAGRIPSPGFAPFDLALYLAVFLGLGAWRARRDT